MLPSLDTLLLAERHRGRDGEAPQDFWLKYTPMSLPPSSLAKRFCNCWPAGHYAAWREAANAPGGVPTWREKAMLNALTDP